MKKLFALLAVVTLLAGCASKTQDKAYHPTDDVN